MQNLAARDNLLDVPIVGDLSRVIDDQDTTVTLTNTAVRSSLYTFTHAAGLIEAGDVLHLEVVGDFQMLSTAISQTLFIKYGSTDLVTSQTTTIGASVGKQRQWRLDAKIMFKTTGTQRVLGKMDMSNATDGNTWGVSQGASFPSGPLYGSGAEDGTASKTLSFDVLMSSATADCIWRMFYAYLELKKKARA
jgi:hypothetical protein